MNLRLNNVLFLLAILVGLLAQGQTASGSGLLSGTYVFREFDMSISQMAASAPRYALSCTIGFNSGNGSYTVTGTKTTSTLTTIQTVPFSASNSWSYGDGSISMPRRRNLWVNLPGFSGTIDSGIGGVSCKWNRRNAVGPPPTP